MPEDTKDQVLMYHRFIEALKFAFAERTRLGDKDFVNVTEVGVVIVNSCCYEV